MSKQESRMYIKRDVYTSKETYIHPKRPRMTDMTTQRDVYK